MKARAVRDLTTTARHMLALAWRADRRVTVWAAVLVLALAGTVAGTGLSQRRLVDAATLGDTGALLAAVALGVLAHTLAAGIGRVQMNLRIDLCERVEVEVSQEVLAATAHLPTLEHLDRAEYLDRITLLRRGNGALAASCWSMAEWACALVSLGLSTWLLASVHPLLILLTVCGLPALALGNRVHGLQHRVTEETAEAVRRERRIHELCTRPETAKEVYVSGAGPELDRRAEELYRDACDRRTRAMLRGVVLDLTGWILYGGGLAVALAITAHLVVTDRVGIGSVVMLATLAGQLRMQISRAVGGLGALTHAGRIARHYLWLREFAATAPRGTEPAPEALKDGIRLRGVSFRYPGARDAVLEGVDLHLPAGSTIGLVGVNGAGKSTLVKLLTGMYRPTEGTILLDGAPLADVVPEEWSARCAGAYQDFAKLQLPVRENVGVGDLPRIGDTAAVEGALERAGASGAVAALPRGVDTQLGRVFDGEELSHGQWQRLALARSAMRRSPLLFVLDEPTAALDPQAEHDLFERFAAHVETGAGEGAVTVLVSHRFSTVHMADRIVVVSGGRVTEQGSHKELLASGGEYARMYAAQAAAYATG